MRIALDRSASSGRHWMRARAISGEAFTSQTLDTLNLPRQVLKGLLEGGYLAPLQLVQKLDPA